MKERPILFSAPMVRAILAGSKTQTRRTAKHPLIQNLSYIVDCENGWWGDEEGDVQIRCPYGQPGDRLWVRETWQQFWSEEIPADRYSQIGRSGTPAKLPETMRSVYRADGEIPAHAEHGTARWKPSIHMPRWASRITLEIVSVRIERLNEISEQDAIVEGVEPNCPLYDHSNCQHDEYFKYPQLEDGFPAFSAIESFQSLWESINGSDSWKKNPWVWVVEFKRVHEKLGESCES